MERKTNQSALLWVIHNKLRVMKYVLYEGENGDMLFTKENLVTPELLKPFTNKTPTLTVEADDDNDAITKLTGHIMTRGANKK